MSQSFSFGFSGDDIEADENDISEDVQMGESPQFTLTADIPAQLKAESHKLEDLVSLTRQFSIPFSSIPLEIINYRILHLISFQRSIIKFCKRNKNFTSN